MEPRLRRSLSIGHRALTHKLLVLLSPRCCRSFTKAAAFFSRGGNTSTHHYYNGLRLGLPVDGGEIWMVAWNVNDLDEIRRARQRLEVTALKSTKSPLVFLKDRAVLFIGTHSTPSPPDVFRDELLKSLPVPTWIVHGAQYASFPELQTVLKQTTEMIEQAKKADHEPYVLDVKGYGIDSLLSKPNVSDDLITFAYKAPGI